MTSENSDSGANPKLSNKFIKKIRQTFKKNHKNGFDTRAYESLDTPTQDMIKGVFELSSKNARDIMIPRVDIVSVDSDTDLKPLVKIICEAGHSRVPIYEEKIDNIIGILYVKDLLKLLIDRPKKKFQLKKILKAPYFVPETMPLEELLLEFKMRKLHMAIVVDEYGGVGGIVTLEDILEEIVGEIVDEFDTDELPEIERKGKNIYEIDSRMTIADFNEALDQKLPTEDFDTIGGYVFDLFGKIPDQGEEIITKNLAFKLKDINGTVINRIIVTVSKKGD